MLVLRVLTPQGQKENCTYTNSTIKSKKQARSNNIYEQNMKRNNNNNKNNKKHELSAYNYIQTEKYMILNHNLNCTSTS